MTRGHPINRQKELLSNKKRKSGQRAKGTTQKPERLTQKRANEEGKPLLYSSYEQFRTRGRREGKIEPLPNPGKPKTLKKGGVILSRDATAFEDSERARDSE